jgi:hypothetical protein
MLYIAMLMTSRQHNVCGDGRKGTEITRGGPAAPAAAGILEQQQQYDELVYEPGPSSFSTGESSYSSFRLLVDKWLT